jgi:peptidoglycan/xylan/chitin deacetylase (PgdA/CDA1 family)
VRSRWLPWLLVACASHVAAAAPLDPKNLTSLTDDPITNKADRIDGDEADGVVAFTFDDGPNPETTPAVIEACKKYNIPTTFFIVTQRITGKRGERSREVLQQELDAGFMIGSHSVTHANLKSGAAPLLAREIDASLRTLAPQINRPVGMFRPPFGAFNKAGRVWLKKLNLTEVLWSVDTLDWKAKNPDRLRAKVFRMITKQNGGVVLMHDVKPITAKIVADVFDDLEAENCQRLTDKREPIIPVSLHYFLKTGKTHRPIPEAVKARTEAYRAALPGRCAARPPRPLPEPKSPLPPVPAQK